MSIPNDIESLKELVANLLVRIQELEAENSELRARLDSNSKNSHRPPSSDGLHKKPALAKKRKAKGGQKGHKGKTLDMVHNPDKTFPCLPPKHCSCGHTLKGVTGQVVERRQVFELPQPKLEVIEYQRWACNCPSCKRVISGQFPEMVKAPVQYGAGVKAFTTLLNVRGCLSHDKIKKLFSDLFGYAINEATIRSASEKVYQALQQSEQEIFLELLKEQAVHFDETGLRANGSLHWLHTSSSDAFTYLFVHKKRGKNALFSDYSLLPFYKQWAVHDCWSSYFGFTDCRHAVCGAHLLRELLALKEQNRKWAAAFRTYLLMLYDLTKQGRRTLSAGLRVWAQRRYDELLAMAKAEEPPPKKKKGQRGRVKATKGYNLYRRLEKHKLAVLAFAFHREVPFTNNQAERDLRPSKVKQKMAGCFRTLRGARIYARIQGFISTAQKHELNVFKELRAALNGYPYSFAT